MPQQPRFELKIFESKGRYRWSITTVTASGMSGYVEFSDETFATEEEARSAGQSVLDESIED